KQKFQCVFEGISKAGNPTLLNQIYTELYITEGGSGEVNEEHEVRQIETASRKAVRPETPITCGDIFKPLPGREEPIRTVMTRGVAGIGKTVLTQKFTLDWAEDQTNHNIHFMFPFTFRELNLLKGKEFSLVELLHHFFMETKAAEICSFEEFQVVLIFDGLDECRLPLDFHNNQICTDVTESTSVDVLLTNLIKGNLLPSARIWITTRPAAANQIPPECVDMVTEVRGFTDPQKEEYFMKRITDEELARRIISHIKRSRSLHIMCHIPVFCWITNTVLNHVLATNQRAEMPNTLTEMYIHFLVVQTKQGNVKYHRGAETDPHGTTETSEMIVSLGKLSFEQLEKGNLIFYESDLTECGIDIRSASVYSGVFTQIFKEERGLYQDQVFCFVHLSVQEFLAALHVFMTFVTTGVNLLRETQSTSNTGFKTMKLKLPWEKPKMKLLLQSAVDKALQSPNGHLDLFLRFLLGLSLETNQTLLRGLVDQTGRNPTLLNQIYTELYITEGGSGEVNEEHEVRQIETASRKAARPETPITCGDIFKPLPGREEPIRTVMTRGVAGIGKTVLTQKFTLDWAEDQTNHNIHFMFPFTFRELNLLKGKEFSLVELLHHFFMETKAAEICSFEEFQVVLIFDGLDECRLPLDFHNNQICTDVTESTSVDVLLTNLIKGNLLPSARIWITTRPAAANQIPPECVDMVTEVRGFTDPQKEEYFMKRITDEELARRIISHIKRSRSLHIMCHIPVFCWITNTVLNHVLATNQRAEMPNTLTEMYIHFLVVQTKQGNVKYHRGAETDPHGTTETSEMIVSLGKLSFEQLEKGNLIFYESDLTECGIDIRSASVYSGVFTQIFKEERGLYQDQVFCFVHLSVQEFLAALHVFMTFVTTGVNLLRETQSTSNTGFKTMKLKLPWEKPKMKLLLQSAVDKALQSPNGHLDLFLRFLLGLSLETNQTLLRGLVDQTGRNPTLLNQIYTELYITEGGSGEVNEEHEVRQIETASRKAVRPETPITCGDIFKPLPGREEPIRTVMTRGVAGIGKTVLTQKFTLDWAEDQTNHNIHFMFPFTFRELNLLKGKEFSLVELLHHFFMETKAAEICSFEEFQVVLIFDGLDECRLPLDFHNNQICTDVTESTSVDVLLTNLIKGNLLPSARIWITTRPAAANQIPPECVDMVTEVRGFTDPQKEEYFMKRITDEELARRIISHIKRSRSLHIMCHIPVFCWITNTVLNHVLATNQRAEMPNTLTEMYIHFLVVQTKQGNVKYHRGAETDPHGTTETSEMIVSLGKLSFEQLEKGNLIFYESDLTECGIDIRSASVYSGVFTQIFKEERGLYQDQVFCFVHLSVQEFLAALHVFMTFVTTGVNLLRETQSTSNTGFKTMKLKLPWEKPKMKLLLQSAVDKALQSPNGHLDLFLRFLLGLSLETNQTLLRGLVDQTGRSSSQTNQETVQYIKEKIRKNPSPERSINLFHCLNELNDHSLVEEIQQYLRNPTLLNQIYTELYITEGGSGAVNEEHEVRQIETASRKAVRPETPITCGDIFNPLPGREEPIRTVMTRGVAGIGKTVLTQKFTLDWAEDQTNHNIHFMFPFTFRELNLLKGKQFSLVELLHHFFIETKEAEICSFEEFQVVLIFDGLDECRLPLDFHNNQICTDVTESTSVDVLLTNLIKGNLLPSAGVWITTRPAAANQIPPECVDMVTEVRGFTDPQKEEYFMKRFRDEELARRIISHIKRSRTLHIMCHIPVFCWITNTVLDHVLTTNQRGEMPNTLTEMYIHFLVVQTKQGNVKYHGRAETDPHWTTETSEMILSLGKLAFEQLEEGNLIFYESDLTECGIDIRSASVYSGVFTQIFKEERGLYQDQQKFQCVFEGISKAGNPTLLNQIYTELYITEGGSGAVNEEHEVRQIETASRKAVRPETPITCGDIFNPLPGREEPIRTVMTRGVAGIGKTVLTQKFTLDWAEDRTNHNIHFMFPFTFRELNLLKGKEFSLVELLHHFFIETKEAEICSFDEFQVVLIFDGLDECRLPLDFHNNQICTDVTESTSVDVLLTNLIKGNLLPSAGVWITTRPAAANQIPPECVDMVTEVRGFTDPQKEEYFMKRFRDEELARRIISHIKRSRTLHIMCHIPVFCWITNTVLDHVLTTNQRGEMPNTLTEMYIHFLVVQTKQGNVKYHGRAETDPHWTTETSEMILSLGKLAFEQLEKGNLIFYESDLTECGIDIRSASVYSGVFTQIFKEERGLYQDQVYCFVHLSVQEFLAALHVFMSFITTGVNLLTETQSTSNTGFKTMKLKLAWEKPKMKLLLQSAVDKALQSPNGHLDLFLRFLLGLSLETNQTLLRGLLTDQSENSPVHHKEKIRENPSPERSINLFHCLNELNDHSLVEEIQQYLRSGHLSRADLSPAQWSALVFILLSSEEELEVFDLKQYSASEEETLAAGSRRELKCNVKQKFQCVFEGISKAGNPTLLNQIYTELYITEGGGGEVNEEHEVRQIETASRKAVRPETPITCGDIFKPLPGREEPIRTVMTRGVAGIGKTVLTQKFTLDWAEDRTNHNIHFIFPFTFRELNLLRGKQFSLVELLHHFFSETKEAEICSFDEFQVVLIFDGLDECRLPLDFHNNQICTDVTESTSVDVLLTNLIKGNLLPSAGVWITTRPAAANQIPPECVDMVTEVRGFTDPQKEEYFMKRFRDEELARRIISHIKRSRTLHIMCHIPVFCWITNTVLDHVLTTNQRGEMPNTLTEMYIHFLVVQTKQGNVKYHGRAETDPHWTTETSEMIGSLGKLSFEQLEKGNLIFYESDLTECGIDIRSASVYSGVFTQIFKEERGLYQDQVYCFVHLSVQEFLAALHVFMSFITTGVNLLTETQSTSNTGFKTMKLKLAWEKPKMKLLLQSAVDKALQSPNGHLDLFLRFLLGLSLETNQTLLRGLVDQTGSSSQTNQTLLRGLVDQTG
ncbi:LOW QUALITY PROTEIN: uncharacterized protein ACN63O_023990, partial [Diretmus argenteus]